MSSDYLTLLLVLSGCGGLLLLAVVVLIALAILRPPRMTDGKALVRLGRLSPDDMGLAFEDEWFTVTDERNRRLRLAGWWIPATRTSSGCALLLHGYADAKVGALAWALPLHRLGFNLLLIDLRAHGESQGRFCTGGARESGDVRQVIQQLRARRCGQSQRLVLFGASLGAVAAAEAAVDDSDIVAVVMDSPLARYRDAVSRQLALLGLGSRWLAWLTVAVAEKIAGVRFDQVDIIATIARLKCPVLVIFGQNDPLISPSDIEKFATAAKGKADGISTVAAQAGSGHVQAVAADEKAYVERLAVFLNRAVARRSGMPAPEIQLHKPDAGL